MVRQRHIRQRPTAALQRCATADDRWLHMPMASRIHILGQEETVRQRPIAWSDRDLSGRGAGLVRGQTDLLPSDRGLLRSSRDLSGGGTGLVRGQTGLLPSDRGLSGGDLSSRGLLRGQRSYFDPTKALCGQTEAYCRGLRQASFPATVVERGETCQTPDAAPTHKED